MIEHDDKDLKTFPHPDETLKRLLAKPGISERKRIKLQQLHSLCALKLEQREFSFGRAQIGRDLEAAGVMTYANLVSKLNPEYLALYQSWKEYVDATDLGLDAAAPPGHPDAVLRELLSVPSRRQSAQQLRAIHKACRARFDRGDYDFSAAGIANELREAGLTAAKAAPRLKHHSYRALIEAWQELALSTAIQLTAADAEHPQLVLKSVLTSRRGTIGREYSQRLYQVCSERFEQGEYDFTPRAVAEALVSAKAFDAAVDELTYRLRNTSAHWQMIKAWQAQADARWIKDSDNIDATHPHSVYQRLKQKTNRTDRLQRLLQVHRACFEEHGAGRCDFSVQAIGKHLAAKGVMAKGSLHKSADSDLRTLVSAWNEYARPWLSNAEPPPKAPPRRQKTHDLTLEWVRQDHPELEEWRVFGVEWLASITSGLGQRIRAIAAFLSKYLTITGAPNAPEEFFSRVTGLPSFDPPALSLSTETTKSFKSYLQEFFEWVLLRNFSAESDDGILIISPAFRNPLTRSLTRRGARRPSQTVRTPLPYGYIHDLKRILASGLNFSDWHFAQTGLGGTEMGAPGRDWFEVEPEVIDTSDPDCVWRRKEFSTGRVVLQMWSPVRWVAVLVKLLLPLRTIQVRLLDSGESDSYKFESGEWARNSGPLAPAEDAPEWRQGVFRRNREITIASVDSTVLYINTNKTADTHQHGELKGYVLPWFAAADTVDNVYYWLEKLRDWQINYNPIRRRTSWSELDGRHIPVKSTEQRDSYLDTCFLFRMAEADAGEQGLPVSDAVVSQAWCNLLEEFQRRLQNQGQTHPGGTPIIFVRRDKAGRFIANDFPLHSLRVSLITALALDGAVPFPILQKLVGHSRLIMTLYYTKIGAARTAETLSEAAKRLEDSREASIIRHLKDCEHERLIETAVFNNPAALGAIIPIQPAERNPAGWMPMHHGLCLVGGNVSEEEGNNRIGGCYNGGKYIDARVGYGPVPGGSRNCVRCRWFVTEPHFLPALAAHFNTAAYHFDEARNSSMAAELELQTIRREKAAAELADTPFDRHQDLLHTERLMENRMKGFSDRAENLVATWRLIERCQALLSAEPTEGVQLIVQGSALEVKAIFEETESELLQLCGVCESVEIYPDFEADKAVLRRSQLLDSALYNDGLPPIFLSLTPSEQLTAGNAFVRRLAKHASPSREFIGQRRVVEIIDAGESLAKALGVDLGSLLPKRATTTLQHPKVLLGLSE